MIAAEKVEVRHQEALAMGDKRKYSTLPLCFKNTARLPSIGCDLLAVFTTLFSCSERPVVPHHCRPHKGLAPRLGVQGPLQRIPIHRSNIIFHCSVCTFSNPAGVSQYFPKGLRHLCFWPCHPLPCLSDAPFLSSHQSKTFNAAVLSHTDYLITRETSLKVRFPDSILDAC